VSDIEITDLEPEHYGVQVTEGSTTTSHHVRLPPDLLGDLGLGDFEPERLVRETFAFLLEREPATSIMEEFSLEDVARFYPEFYDELRTRLGE
jgi:hypothetical protein